MQSGLGNYTHSMPSDFWDRVAREVAHRLIGQYGGLGQLGQLGQQGLAWHAQAGMQAHNLAASAQGIGHMNQQHVDPYAEQPPVNRSRTVT